MLGAGGFGLKRAAVSSGTQLFGEPAEEKSEPAARGRAGRVARAAERRRGFG